MSLNPINDILSGTYESDVPKLHTSGRRESRITQTKGYYVPRPDGKPGTLPIKRDKPKVKGKKKNKRKSQLGTA